MHLPRVNMLLVIALCLVFMGGFSSGYILCVFQPSSLTEFLKDKTVIAWIGAGVNLAVVFVALFVNVLHEHLRKPRFRITSGQEPPYQIVESVNGAETKTERLYVRFCAENCGLTATEGCEVRLEKIEAVQENEGKEVLCALDHDPRPLKWVGRSCSPIALSPGAFDFVDLGAQNEDYQENFRIEFDERGHLDLNLVKDSAKAYILRGHVYGKGAVPQDFSFRMKWEVDSVSPLVVISEV